MPHLLQPQQLPGLRAFVHAGEAEGLCPASPAACEMSQQRDSVGSHWVTEATRAKEGGMGCPHWLPTANWGAGCKRHPHPRAPESGCLPGTLRHVCITLAGARLDAGTLTASITTHRRPCPKAAVPLHSQDTLRHPSGSCAQVYYRAGEQVCSGKRTQRRIFSLALLRDVCCLHCQVPSLPPGAALATNPTGRCTEQGLQTRSVTWGNFILFSSACREMGWHKPPALQPLPFWNRDPSEVPLCY